MRILHVSLINHKKYADQCKTQEAKKEKKYTRAEFFKIKSEIQRYPPFPNPDEVGPRLTLNSFFILITNSAFI